MTTYDLGLIIEVAILAVLIIVLLVLLFKPVKETENPPVTQGEVKVVPYTPKVHKTATVVTYIIALLCLWAGLLAPMYYVGGETFADRMLLLYIPSATNSALGNELFTGDWVKPFTELYQMTIFGQAINIYAHTLFVYACISVLGILFLFPILFIKKDKIKCVACAYVIEVAAALALGCYLIFALLNYYIIGDWINYGVLIAFGGVILMLVIQSIMNKGSLGFCKTVLFLLSALAVLTLYDVTALVPAIAEPLQNIANAIYSSLSFTADTLGISYFVVFALNLQEMGTLIAELETISKIAIILLTLAVALGVINFLIDIIGLATYSKRDRDGYLAVNSFSKVFGFVRYGIEFLLAIIAIILLLVQNQQIGLFLYIFAIVVLIQTIIEFVRVSRRASIREANKKIVRNYYYSDGMNFSDGDADSGFSEEIHTIVYTDNIAAGNGASITEAQKTAEVIASTYDEEQTATGATVVYRGTNQQLPEDTDDNYDVDENEQEDKQEEVPVDKKSKKKKKVNTVDDESEEDKERLFADTYSQAIKQSKPDDVEEKTKTIVYNVKTVYNGPTDEFIDTLTDEEKVEFSKAFIEKSKGGFEGLPDYVVNGDNEEFFTTLFACLNSNRKRLSNGLLHKIYLKVTNNNN
jgi:hypothetical protein